MFDWHSVTVSEYETVNSASRGWHDSLILPPDLIYSLMLRTNLFSSLVVRVPEIASPSVSYTQK